MVLKEFVERPLIMSAVSRPARAQTSRLLSTYHLAGRRPGRASMSAAAARRPALFVPSAARLAAAWKS